MQTARKPQTSPWRAQRRGGGERGLPVSRCSLFQDQFLQRQIRYRLAKPRVFRLKLLEPLDLVALQPATFLVTSVTPIGRTASATDRPCDVRTSTCRNLPQLGDDLLGFMPFPGHFESSFGYKNHTLGRITFQGEGHRYGHQASTTSHCSFRRRAITNRGAN